MVTTIYGTSPEYVFIAEWMKFREMDDAKLARRLKVDRVTVTRYRTEHHRLNPGKMAAIAAALGIKPADLWRPPGSRPSIDAMLDQAPPDVQEYVHETAERALRLIQRR